MKKIKCALIKGFNIFVKIFTPLRVALICAILIWFFMFRELSIGDLSFVVNTFTERKYSYTEIACDTSINRTRYTYQAPISKMKAIIQPDFFNVLGMDCDCQYADIGNKYFIEQNRCQSFTYRTRWNKGIRGNNHFLVYLDSISPDSTQVRVHSLRSEITVEKKFGHNNTVEERVPSNRILEYSILYYLGKSLDERNMPKIIFPDGLSRRKVIDTYKSFNDEGICPFTKEELFKSAG